MIHVLLFAGLTSEKDPSAREFELSARPGLTVADATSQAGVSVEQVRIVVINGRAAGLDAVLSDDDRVALFPAVSGG